MVNAEYNQSATYSSTDSKIFSALHESKTGSLNCMKKDLNDEKKNKIDNYVELPPSKFQISGSIQWYLNMIFINFIEFSSESSRGIILATIFLYSQSLGGDLAFMGMLTSIFSVGRFLSSMIFGWMCDRYSFKTVYLTSSIICLLGNFLYLLADSHVTSSLYLLAFSRFVVGFGAGNRSVCRANVAAITSVEQRLKYITILATVVFLGYALTPGLGSLVSNADTFFLGVHINKFTAPAVILMSFNTFAIFLTLTIFDESVGKKFAPLVTPTDNKSNIPKILTTNVPEKLVKIGVAVFIFLNFNARGILSIFETVNIPLFLEVTHHDPSSKIAVVEASNFQFQLGLIGLLSYLSIEIFRNRLNDVMWLTIGFSATAIGNLVLAISPNEISFIRLCIGECLVWSVGCPLTTAVVVAAFSKILGGRPQGTLMGLLGSAASISRMTLPILPSFISSLAPLFIINLILCGSSVVALLVYQRKIEKWKVEHINSFIDEESPLILGSRNPTYYETDEENITVASNSKE